MNVAIEIPDDVARALGARAGEVSRAVLQAVAIEAYRAGMITPAQVQQMLGLRPRWETEAFLRRAAATNGMENLQAGEQAAILLAQLVKTNVILLDEKSARRATRQRTSRATFAPCSARHRS